MRDMGSAVSTCDEGQAEATAWAHSVLSRRGAATDGPWTVERVRPWATTMSAPTSIGLAWLKAVAPAVGHEPTVHQILSEHYPGLVPPVIAVDEARGWLLMPDAGRRCDEEALVLKDWLDLVSQLVSFQRASLDIRPQLSAAGLPDRRPTTLAATFDRLLHLVAELPPDHPDHLEPQLLEPIAQRRPDVSAAAGVLDGSGFPAVLNHGDLHPHNLLRKDGEFRIIDFGGASWSTAPEALVAPASWIRKYDPEIWDSVASRYWRLWGVDGVDRADVWSAVLVSHHVNRAAFWHRIGNVTGASSHDRWVGMTAKHLRSLLDG